MKMQFLNTLLILRFLITTTIVILGSERIVAQVFEFRRIAAGADSGEIYISCYWYDTFTTDPYGGLFRSTDHGQTLSVQYKDIWLGGILYSDIYGDLLKGTLYTGQGFRVSHDYGSTWELHNIPFTLSGDEGGGGSVSGEVYFSGYDTGYVHILYHGTHFGDSLYLMNTHMDSLHRIEAGSLLGEIFALKWPYWGGFNPDTLGLAFSNNFGQSFNVKYLDTSIVQSLLQYTLTHGPDTGEIYLIGRKAGTPHYHILHSSNYGQTFSLQYITPEYTPGWDEFSFVAGREPGSFYILQYHYCATLPLHTCLEIYYSSDYGVTYSVFYHELDSTYTSVPSVPQQSDPFTCFPNPVNDQLKIKFSENQNESVAIEVFDMMGRVQHSLKLEPHKHEISLIMKSCPPGVYLLLVTTPGKMIGIKKVIVSR